MVEGRLGYEPSASARRNRFAQAQPTFADLAAVACASWPPKVVGLPAGLRLGLAARRARYQLLYNRRLTHLFVRPTVSMTQRAWVEAHVAAFEFFGGAPRRLVPDYVARHIISYTAG